MLKRYASLIVLSLAALALVASAGHAEEVKSGEKTLVVGKWYPKLDFGLVLTQSAYSQNWNGGEQGQIAWTWILNSGLENQLHRKVNWLNTLKLAFGHTHNQKFDENDPGVRVWDRPEKTTDLVDLESIFRLTMGRWVDPYLAGRLLSQFLDNTDPHGRNLYATPMTIFASAGVAREFYRTEEEMFVSRLGGAFRNNIRQFYPNEPPDDSKQTDSSHDAGIEWVTDYRVRVLEDKVLWTSKLTVYKPFEYSFRGTLEDVHPDSLANYGISSDVSEYPLAVDVNWENIFSAEITSWLNVNLYVMFIYDKYDNSVIPIVDENGNLTNPGAVNASIRKAGQFKQTLGIGLTYKFL
jgi:hypothetical protein